MREFDEEPTELNASAFFATLATVLFAGIIVLFIYSKEVIDDYEFKSITSKETISNLLNSNDELFQEGKRLTRLLSYESKQGKTYREQIEIRDVIIDKLEMDIDICTEVQKLIEKKGESS